LQISASQRQAQQIYQEDDRMPDRTSLFALIGVALYCFGLYGWSHMKFRVLGAYELFRNVPHLTHRYDQLVRAGDAPVWPLIAWRVCPILGVAIALGAVLING
jgi:hypothetical protein